MAVRQYDWNYTGTIDSVVTLWISCELNTSSTSADKVVQLSASCEGGRVGDGREEKEEAERGGGGGNKVRE